MSGRKRDRDRAMEAFRRWARAGCPGMDQIRDVKGAEDLRACVRVFAELESGGKRVNAAGHEIMEAVRGVYMFEPRRTMRRADVTMRVRRAAGQLCADERTIYRWLAAARRMWAGYRNKTCQ